MNSNILTYNYLTLPLYDTIVIHATNPFIWGCNNTHIIQQYQNYFSHNHCEIGAGTGYFLKKTITPNTIESTDKLYLVDSNKQSLDYATHALRKHVYNCLLNQESDSNKGKNFVDRLVDITPIVGGKYENTIVTPLLNDASVWIDLPDNSVDSVGANFVYHCLPASVKKDFFTSIDRIVKPGGVVFGSTVLGNNITTTCKARILNKIYNQTGVFDNSLDTIEDFVKLVDNRGNIDVQGNVLLFNYTV